MKTPLFIAKHYLLSRKQKSVINVISWISLVGIAVGTAALIVVLSVYNGIGEVTQGLYNVFDPELVIQPSQGKTFHTTDDFSQKVLQVKGVEKICPIVEENAWVTHKHNEAIVQLRGVDEHYGPLTGLDTMLSEGVYSLQGDFPNADGEHVNFLLLGGEIYYNLGLSTYTNSPLAIHIPKRGSGIGMTMEDAFNIGYAYSAGNFYLQQDIDSKYVVAHIDLVRRLMDYDDDEVTMIAVAVDKPTHIQKVKEQLRETLGKDFQVKDRFDQQPLYYKVFRSERIGVFLILSLIVLIATLNLISSLSLLIIDKKKDISLLKAIGMDQKGIRQTFVTEGFLISLVGIAAGLLLGFIICFLQQKFGIVKMGSNYVISAFPVSMRWQDFLATTLVVSLLSLLSVLYTIRKAKL